MTQGVYTGRKRLEIASPRYLSPEDIKFFSICPRLFYYWSNESTRPNKKDFIRQRWLYHNRETQNVIFECFKEVCKYAFLYRLRKNTNTGWSGVRSAIGIILSLRSQRQLPIPTDIAPLLALCQNFHKHFLNTTFAWPTLPNFPVTFNICRGPHNEEVSFTDIFHAVGLADTGYYVVDFKHINVPPLKYDTSRFLTDPTILTRYWAFTHSTKRKPDKYFILYTCPERSSTLKLFTIYPHQSNLILEGEQNITYIIKGCIRGINYQSKTTYCQHCQYKERCYPLLKEQKE